MATTEDITIKITVDDNGAIKALNNAGNELESLDPKTKKASEGFFTLNKALVAGAAALGGLTVAFAAISNQLNRAKEVEGVSAGFLSLQGSAGAAETALRQLKSATGNTVTELELMRVANQSVQAGIPIDKLVEFSGAARKVGAAVGRDALEAINDFNIGMQRQSVQILDNLQIFVNAEVAYEKFKKANNILGRELTSVEKKAAFQAEAVEQLIDKANGVADVNETAAIAFEQLATAIEDTRDQVSLLISDSEGLKRVLQGATKIVKDFSTGLEALFGGDTSQLAIAKQIQDLNKELADTEDLLKSDSLTRLVNLTSKSDLLTKQAALKNSIKLLTEEFKKLAKEAPEAEKGVKGVGDAAGPTAKELEKLRKEQEKLLEAQRKQAEELQRVVEGSSEYEQILKKVRDGTISNEEAADRLNFLYADTGTTIAQLKFAQKDLVDALAGVGDEAGTTGDRILQLNDKIATLKKEIADAAGSGELSLQDALLGIGEGTDSAKNSQLLGKLSDEFELGFSQQGQDAAGAFIASFLSNIETIGNSTEESVQGVTTGLGAAIGGYFGGESGAAIGGQLGDLLGGAIGGLFASENAGAVARDSIDAFFEDALDQNRVSLVINGQLQKIKDIAENDYQNFFETLDTSTESGANQFGGFEAVGTALAEMFQVGEELGAQFGATLGNNVGGTLNNLQILLQELNVSQESLGKALEESWLDGDLSAQRFLETQAQIANVYAKGIPDGVGRTDLAFQNLIESGGAGRQVVDALGDAAIEAQEKGISTLEELKAELIASGQDADKVTQAFDAIAAAGITNLDSLADISVQSAATIGAQLESTGTFFEDVTANLEDVQAKLDAIKDKEVNLTFNVRTNVDENTKSLGLDQGLPQPNTDTNFGAVQ